MSDKASGLIRVLRTGRDGEGLPLGQALCQDRGAWVREVELGRFQMLLAGWRVRCDAPPRLRKTAYQRLEISAHKAFGKKRPAVGDDEERQLERKRDDDRGHHHHTH